MASKCIGDTYLSVADIGGTASRTGMPNGRYRWTLETHIAPGRRGCTLIDTPSLRWSSYVHQLRVMGASIETITELQHDPSAGFHACDVRRASVTRGGELAA